MSVCMHLAITGPAASCSASGFQVPIIRDILFIAACATFRFQSLSDVAKSEQGKARGMTPLNGRTT